MEGSVADQPTLKALSRPGQLTVGSPSKRLGDFANLDLHAGGGHARDPRALLLRQLVCGALHLQQARLFAWHRAPQQ